MWTRMGLGFLLTILFMCLSIKGDVASNLQLYELFSAKDNVNICKVPKETIEDFLEAIDTDFLVNKVYKKFNITKNNITYFVVNEPFTSQVSFEKNGDVFMSRQKINIQHGEILFKVTLANGVMFIRRKCCNQLPSKLFFHRPYVIDPPIQILQLEDDYEDGSFIPVIKPPNRVEASIYFDYTFIVDVPSSYTPLFSYTDRTPTIASPEIDSIMYMVTGITILGLFYERRKTHKNNSSANKNV